MLLYFFFCIFIHSHAKILIPNENNAFMPLNPQCMRANVHNVYFTENNRLIDKPPIVEVLRCLPKNTEKGIDIHLHDESAVKLLKILKGTICPVKKFLDGFRCLNLYNSCNSFKLAFI